MRTMPTAKRSASAAASAGSLSRDDKLMLASLRRDLQGLPLVATHAPPTSPLWQLKVTLEDTDPPIWRRLVVPAELTLVELHAVLQLAMGWTNSHLHAFRIGDARFEIPAPEPGWADDDNDAEDERLARLSDVAPSPKARFSYEYDFGDSWEHKIVLEKTASAEPGVAYPRVVDGALACPPEDVGGVGGYYDFLAAMADRRHPRHKELRKWHGQSFAAEAFDMAPINRRLEALFQSR